MLLLILSILCVTTWCSYEQWSVKNFNKSPKYMYVCIYVSREDHVVTERELFLDGGID